MRLSFDIREPAERDAKQWDDEMFSMKSFVLGGADWSLG